MNHHARNWMLLGVFALALSGLYSVILVCLRAPILTKMVDPSLFRTSLVVHVDLSVLVWLLSVISSLWCLSIPNKRNYFVKYSLYTSLLGTVLISLSPIVGDNNPVMNNYIPMLENWCFISGIVIFLCGITLNALIALSSRSNNWLYYANASSAILVIMSIICFVLAYIHLDRLLYPLDLHFFYEMLFWSGGHVLQFAYVSGAMLAWIILFEKYSNHTLEGSVLYNAIFVLNAVLALPSFFAHYTYTIDHPDFTNFFTLHMKYCGGIAPVLLACVISLDMLSRSPSSPWKKSLKITVNSSANSAFLCSIVLFFAGGVIGFLISGTNVTIPAHYHGMVVGISMTFMAVSYTYLWQENEAQSKVARMQPYVYSIGQIMHISGLAWSGGYGVMRKTPGVEMSSQAKISMGIMGLGGLIAIIGGLMFVYVCTKKCWGDKRTTT